MEIPLWLSLYGNPVMTGFVWKSRDGPKIDRKSSVTERDIRKYFRGAMEVGPDTTSGTGTIETRLSSSSCVDVYYSFVRVRRLNVTKDA